MLGQIFSQTYSMTKGINKFGDKGLYSALEEVNQIHDRTCFRIIGVKNLTSKEAKGAI